jgi:acyl carrier protein
MSSNLFEQVRDLLATYVDVAPQDFRMDASLDLAYDMDSTERTELAKKVEERFGVRASKSQRDDWETGNDLCRFLEKELAAEAVA